MHRHDRHNTTPTHSHHATPHHIISHTTSHSKVLLSIPSSSIIDSFASKSIVRRDWRWIKWHLLFLFRPPVAVTAKRMQEEKRIYPRQLHQQISHTHITPNQTKSDYETDEIFDRDHTSYIRMPTGYGHTTSSVDCNYKPELLWGKDGGWFLSLQRETKQGTSHSRWPQYLSKTPFFS